MVISTPINYKIECYNSDLKLYTTFSPDSTDLSGKNLLSYNFNRNTEEFVGNFSFSVKEDPDGETVIIDDEFSFLEEKVYFLDKVAPLDIIKIYEYETIVFIGVVETVSFGATVGAGNKRITVSGKSVERLWEMLEINLDTTAMSLLHKEPLNIDLINNIWDVKDQQRKAPSLKKIFTCAAFSFFENAKKYTSISNSKICELLEKLYNIKGDEIGSFEIGNLTISDEEFEYPICNLLYGDSIVNLITYLRGFCPKMAYEFFGTIKNEQPYLVVREVPFWTQEKNVWANLRRVVLPSEIITNFTFSRSNRQIYTAFVSYLNGSLQSADFYQNIQASEKGYSSAKINDEKLKLYGYKPLTVSFNGYQRIASKASEDSSPDSEDDYITERFTKLNQKLCDWYGDLDMLYTGSVTIANKNYCKIPAIGERVVICSGHFYVKGESHSWSFGGTPQIEYEVDRGAYYGIKGPAQLDDLSAAYAEITQGRN